MTASPSNSRKRSPAQRGSRRATTLALLGALAATVFVVAYPVVLAVQEMMAVFDTIGAIAAMLVTLVLWLETLCYALLELITLILSGQWSQLLVRPSQLLGLQ